MSSRTVAQELVDLFERDLERMVTQVEAYSSEDRLWGVAPGITNSGGTLAAHVAGNLLHFIGAEMGGTGYVRDRVAEFSGDRRPTATLVGDLREAARVVAEVLPRLSDETLEAPITGGPEVFQGRSTRWFLMHLYGHLNWHLGEVDYHRRILDA